MTARFTVSALSGYVTVTACHSNSVYALTYYFPPVHSNKYLTLLFGVRSLQMCFQSTEICVKLSFIFPTDLTLLHLTTSSLFLFYQALVRIFGQQRGTSEQYCVIPYAAMLFTQVTKVLISFSSQGKLRSLSMQFSDSCERGSTRSYRSKTR